MWVYTATLCLAEAQQEKNPNQIAIQSIQYMPRAVWRHNTEFLSDHIVGLWVHKRMQENPPILLHSLGFSCNSLADCGFGSELAAGFPEIVQIRHCRSPRGRYCSFLKNGFKILFIYRRLGLKPRSTQIARELGDSLAISGLQGDFVPS